MVFFDLLVVFSLLQLSLLSLATNKELDLELRLAPPGSSGPEQSEKYRQPISQSVQTSNQMKTGKEGRPIKRKRGRPALELSVSVISSFSNIVPLTIYILNKQAEEKVNRRRAQIRIANHKYEANLKKDVGRYEDHLKRRQERRAETLTIQLQDPKRKAEIIEMRKKHKKTYFAKKLKKSIDNANVQK